MPPKRKPAKGKAYGVAPVLPPGEVVSDHRRHQWTLGKSFATGGFGRIYLAQNMEKGKGSLVLKMEPSENGPLFQEIHVYLRICKPDVLDSWKKKKGLSFLGVPPFLGSGLHKHNDNVYRFLVMPHYGSDLEKLREATPVLDPAKVVLPLGRTVLNALEYIHSVNHVHADVKAENLLLESTSGPKDWSRMVLVDFGLAKRIPDKPVYKEQPKRRHNGTLIFTSLDAHRGCEPSYRGDVEILGYNLIYWLSGSLPWLHTTSPEAVQDKKTEFSKNLKRDLTKILASTKLPFVQEFVEFFEYAYALDYAKKPDFDLLRDLVGSAMKKAKRGAVSKANWSVSKSGVVSKVGRKRSSSQARLRSSASSESESEIDDSANQACSSLKRLTVKQRANSRLLASSKSPLRSAGKNIEVVDKKKAKPTLPIPGLINLVEIDNDTEQTSAYGEAASNSVSKGKSPAGVKAQSNKVVSKKTNPSLPIPGLVNWPSGDGYTRKPIHRSPSKRKKVSPKKIVNKTAPKLVELTPSAGENEPSENDRSKKNLAAKRPRQQMVDKNFQCGRSFLTDHRQ